MHHIILAVLVAVAFFLITNMAVSIMRAFNSILPLNFFWDVVLASVFTGITYAYTVYLIH